MTDFNYPAQAPGDVPPPLPPARREPMPVFSKIIFIVDLFFCGFRLLLVPLGVIGYFAMHDQEGAALSVVEVAGNFLIAIIGIPAAVFLLMSKPWAPKLGYLVVLLVLASMPVSILQVAAQANKFEKVDKSLESADSGATPDSTQQSVATGFKIGMYIGIGFTVLVRLALIIVYVVALRKYEAWMRQRSLEVFQS